MTYNYHGQGQKTPGYWPIRIACHCMNPIAWLFGWRFSWIAGQTRFEIWRQKKGSDKLHKVY